MRRHKVGNLSSLMPEELQAQCDELCVEDPDMKAYNLVVYGIDILSEAAVEGNIEACKGLVHLAEEILQVLTFKELFSERPKDMARSIVGAGIELLYKAAEKGNVEASKRLAHLGDEAVQVGGDRNL